MDSGHIRAQQAGAERQQQERLLKQTLVEESAGLECKSMSVVTQIAGIF